MTNTTPILRMCFALGMGAVAGYFFYWMGLPLPWMLGPMVVNTIAAILSAPITAPIKLRIMAIPVIGVMLGSAVSIEIIQHLTSWAVSFAMLVPHLAVAAGFSFLFYRYVGGYDVVSAYFSSMPGGLNEMVLLGEEKGGDPQRIAMAHGARILLVVACVAVYFGVFQGVSSGGQSGRAWVPISGLGIQDYAVLGSCAIIGFFAGKRLGLPAGGLLGPMILSAAAHIAGLVLLPPPSILVIVAQVVMGTIIGCRFVGAKARNILRDLFLGFFATVGMLLTGVMFAWIVSSLSSADPTQTFLAYAPGGLTEMSLLAFALGGDIAYVSITHVARVTLVVMLAPFLLRILGRK